MNRSRFDELSRGLTGLASKVFAAVPISEAWTAAQILGEMNRLGMSGSLRTTIGAAAGLVSQGLVREPTTGKFIRTEIREAAAQAGAAAPAAPRYVARSATPALAVPPPPPSTMDQLASLAASIRVLADQAMAIAAKIDDAALEAEGGSASLRAEADKMRQLRELFNGPSTQAAAKP